jgi:hypothetical protein
MGDFDEAFGEDPDGMMKIAATYGLQDLMTLRHSNAPPVTFARGRKRLDYALGSPRVADLLENAGGHEPFNSCFHSDHRAYFLDFSTARLFGTETKALGQHAPRILHSNNVKQSTRYVKLVKYDLLLQHNALFEQGNQLSNPGNRLQFAERLDKDLVAASLVAEQQFVSCFLGNTI